jgi:predicted transcriptional regulator of viral defense system
MFIEQLKAQFNNNEPIFTSEILVLFSGYTRAYIFRLINKAKTDGQLLQYDNGVYFIPDRSILGLSTITADDVARKKYVSDNGKIYGVYSGLKLQNDFSLTTQMPNTIEIVTNNETMRCRSIDIDGRKFILRKSRCQINKDNVAAYTILQLFTEIDNSQEFDDISVNRIKSYAKNNNVSAKKIIEMANIFPAKTTKNLLCSGVLNEIA